MIDRPNANDPNPTRIPSARDLMPSVHPWSTPGLPAERPGERAGGREGQSRTTSAAACVYEGTPAMPWPPSDEGEDRVPGRASPALLERLVGLREAVQGYVGQRRAEGAPVERVLAEVKALVRRAEGCDLAREATDALVPEVVRWGIEAFYDGGAPLAVARRDP